MSEIVWILSSLAAFFLFGKLYTDKKAKEVSEKIGKEILDKEREIKNEINTTNLTDLVERNNKRAGK